MEVRDIPRHQVEGVVPVVKEMRQQAPYYLVALIEDGRLENVENIRDVHGGGIQALGGESSACYLLENNGKKTFVKFRPRGVFAEVESLQAWGERGASVPHIQAVTEIRDATIHGKPVQALVMDAVVGENGENASDGYHFLSQHPDRRTSLSRLMGTELALMHRTQSDKPFGGFADTWGAGSPYETLTEFYTDRVKNASEFLTRLGITDEQIAVLMDKIRTTAFPQKGVYVHGDYGLHNVLVESTEPLRIKVIDPNPDILDPYWDLAYQYNRLERKKALSASDPSDQNFKESYEKEQEYLEGLMQGYQAVLGIEELDSSRLVINQIVKDIGSLRYHETKSRSAQPKDIDISKEVLKKRILTFVDVNGKEVT